MLKGTILSSFINYEPLKYQDYVYPFAANVVGLIFALSAVSAIPIVGIYKFCSAKGDTFKAVCVFHLIANLQRLVDVKRYL